MGNALELVQEYEEGLLALRDYGGAMAIAYWLTGVRGT